jgi:hypothetical protein
MTVIYAEDAKKLTPIKLGNSPIAEQMTHMAMMIAREPIK